MAALISGYSLLYTGAVNPAPGDLSFQADVCAGWRSDGTMMVSIGRGDGVPVPVGPAAATLEPQDDPLSWHPIETLAPGAVRRRRLVDVAGGPRPQVWAMFSDTHVDDNGRETVLHQYVVEAEVDAAGETLLSCRATPKVLPWNECPEAAGSAERLAGVPLEDIRSLVGADLKGTSTCTHLNDLLRSLGDLPALLATLG